MTSEDKNVQQRLKGNEGQFSFSDIAAGKYILKVVVPGFEPVTQTVLLKGMSREIPPLRLDADALFGIQPNCLNVHSRFENGLAQGRVAYFVPACEAQERFLFPVVPYPCRDGAIRF
jgi:hypothetical protein